MFASEIRKQLAHIKNFIGVFSRDNIPQNLKGPVGLIVNTDTSDLPGAHWIAIYIDENQIGEYFDSYGLPPLYAEFEDFLTRECTNGWMYNRITLQCTICVTCGEYCVAYLLNRFYGGSYADYISLFTSNTYKNDDLIKIYFDLLNKNIQKYLN